jgi:hypothetical protein
VSQYLPKLPKAVLGASNYRAGCLAGKKVVKNMDGKIKHLFRQQSDLANLNLIKHANLNKKGGAIGCTLRQNTMGGVSGG